MKTYHNNSEPRFSDHYQNQPSREDSMTTGRCNRINLTTHLKITAGAIVALALFFFGISTASAQTITGVNITQPTTTTIVLNLGDPATAFTASAVGAAAIAYEWYVDGELQIGQTSANFSFPTPAAEGVYSVYAAAVNAATGSNSARSIEITVIVTAPPPPSNWAANKYVGTFHRNGETGERIIYSGNIGAWTATIEDPTGQGSFIRIDDGSSDPTLYSRLKDMYINDNWSDPETSPAVAAGTAISGNGNILFRVGMASQNTPTATAAPRYGRIVVTSTAPGSPHYIYVRQGEQADNISTSTSNNNDYNEVKWSPYNVGNYLGAGNAGNIVTYPSQTGYFYQWNNPPQFYAPQGAISWVYTVVGSPIFNVCPTGYKIPAGAINNGPSELSSLIYSGSNNSISTESTSPWGYYADGWFDRRKIEATAEGDNPGSNAVVSKGNDGVAYIGRLIYNLTTKASIFLPASGYRDGGENTNGSGNGTINVAGLYGCYWSGTPYSSSYAFHFSFDRSWYSIGGGNYRTDGQSVRCILDDTPPPPSEWADNKYVGTFHRNSETGERIIYSGHTGAWTATIENPTGQGSFIRIDDGSSDPTLSSRLKDMYVNDNWVNPETFPVVSAGTTVSGNGNILFRVGMASQNTPTATAAPRYGRIKVTWNNAGTPTDHYIYVRQGEQADNISELTTNGWNEVKWSPYNVGNYGTPNQYGYDKLTDYPSKAGFFYQWMNTEPPTGYQPTGPQTLPTTPETASSMADPCPGYYKLPAGGSTNFEQRSLSTDAGVTSAWGYYADGFFDRRKIVTSEDYRYVPGEGYKYVESEPKAAVALNSDDVAYQGRVFYHPTTFKSLFLSAAGERPTETLGETGYMGYYWSGNESDEPTKHNAYSLQFDETSSIYIGSGMGGTTKILGFSVRCILDDMPPPPANWAINSKYIGTFHRNTEMGERVIYSGHTGSWTASIEDPTGQGSFIRIDDGSSDPTLNARLKDMYVNDNWVDPEPYKVTSANPTVSGNGNILFRVGMATTNSGTPRYGRIKVTWNNAGTPEDHYIYVRQGEQAVNISTTTTNDWDKVKWSVYNVGNYGTPSQYGNGGFVDYPTKAGYYYQWSNPAQYYAPQGTVSWVNTVQGTDMFNVCPTGYKVPTGNDDQSSEIESLMGFGGSSSDIGYYADGWFDRRKIFNTNMPLSTVSTNNDDVAYRGRLVYNLSNNASLFLPFDGDRDNYNPGVLVNPGSVGSYRSSTPYGSSNSAYYLAFGADFLYSIFGTKIAGMPVRCVAEPPVIGLSDDNLEYEWDESGEGIGDIITVTLPNGCSDSWTISIVPPTATWLTVSPTTGANGGDFMVYPNSNNTTCANRTATITVSACGQTATVVVTQVSQPAKTITLSSGEGSNAQTLCMDEAITPITYTTTNATNATFTNLPAGVTGSWSSNTVTISGTPTTYGTFNYTVTPTGCGTATATGTIVINQNPDAPSTISGGPTCVTSLMHPSFLVYNAPAATGMTFNWTVPPGWTIVSGQGTNSISVKAGGTTTGNVTISVTRTNDATGCTSPPRVSSNIFYQYVPIPQFADYNLGADPTYNTAKKQMEYLHLHHTGDTDGHVYGGYYQWGRGGTNVGYYAINPATYEIYDGLINVATLVAGATYDANGQILTYNGSASAANLFICANDGTQNSDWRGANRKDDLWGNGYPVGTRTDDKGFSDPGIKMSDGYSYQSTSWVMPQNDPCPSGWRVPTQDEWERLGNYGCDAQNVAAGNFNFGFNVWVSTINGYTWVRVREGKPDRIGGIDNQTRGYAIYDTDVWNAAIGTGGYFDGLTQTHTFEDFQTAFPGKTLYDAGAPTPIFFFPFGSSREPWSASSQGSKGHGGYYLSSSTYQYSNPWIHAPYMYDTAYHPDATLGLATRAGGIPIRCVAE